MEYKNFNGKIVLRLDKGDEVVSSVKSVCQKENIRLAEVTGIGGTDDFTIGVFNVQRGKYNEKTFHGTHEITSIVGNINTMNGEIYAHLHANFAKTGCKTVGGHLIRSVISLTSEIIITAIDETVDRCRDTTLNINKFKFQ